MAFRLRDLLLACLLFVLLLPLTLVIILSLWISQGRVFFTQIRPGLNEKPFKLIKFSTMRDAAPGVDEAYNQQARLTFVGKYLRKFSLDEIPQLINVIKGDMSLVGPRPLLMDYLSLYTESEHHRHDVKPGITGLAQINGRNSLSFKQRFVYDLWYVRNQSIWLDTKIMIRTILKVCFPDGVYANELTTSPRFDGTN